MNYSSILVGLVFAASSVAAYAGGSPDFVAFPSGYGAIFSKYTTMNRSASAAVAKMYANDTALSSYKKGRTAASGSILVMEVYKPKKDADGNPIVGKDGVNEIGKLAAIAVMERRDAWPANYAAGERVGTWGFAIYNPDGTPKKNNLTCVACHTPLTQQDFLFSQKRLIDYIYR